MNKLIAPSTDFRAVRDGRNSQVFYVDVALDTARSAAAGTGLVLPISGNSFYCDANPMDGNAFVHFQDTNFDSGPVPLYVSPGVIFNIPYTKVLIENTAQPGKKIRIAYGIDVDFQPGSVAQIAVTNSGGFTAVRPEQSTGFYSSNGALAANTADVIFTPAANINGAILLSANSNTVDSAVSIANFVAKNSSPASIVDGEIIAGGSTLISTTVGGTSVLPICPQFIAAGKGLYFISSLALTAGGIQYRSARYKLL